MTIRNPFKKKPQKSADRTPAVTQAPVAKKAAPAPYRSPRTQEPVTHPAQVDNSYLYATPPSRSDDCAPTTSHHSSGSGHTSHDSGSSYGGHSSHDSGSSSSYDGGSSSSSCDSGGGF